MKILAIEGQGNMPFIRNMLIAPMLKRHSFWVEWMPWYEYPRYKPNHYDLIIGHSLGGAAALEIAKVDYRPTYLTIDPRHMSNLSFFDALYMPFLGSFKIPSAARIYNFYQRGFMSGYPVESPNAVNKFVWSTHMTIPGNKYVRQAFRIETMAIRLGT